MIAENKLIFRAANYNRLDHYFALRMLKLAGKESLELYLAGGLVCHQASKGNVCLDLEAYSEQKLEWQDGQDRTQTLICPSLNAWKKILKSMAVVGVPGSKTPLVLDEQNGRILLYLNRYWQYEQRLAASILARLKEPVVLDEDLLRESLNHLFPSPSNEEDLQRKATEIALRHRFCVISGGPGTGKTTTVVKILALLLKQAKNIEYQIALAAPTGKAAAHLKEAILNGKQSLIKNGQLSEADSLLIPETASTIHALLGAQKNSVYFRRNKERPLLLDCLIVDEASMVDLALMSKLVDALPLQTRLILLGDKNQLSSVEAGSVLGDLCEDFPEKSPILRQSIVHLQKSHRFNDQKGIGLLSREINQMEEESAWNVLKGDHPEVTHAPLPSSHSSLKARLKEEVLGKYRTYLTQTQAKEVGEVFSTFKSFIVLCALRRGLYGSHYINQLLEELLREEKLIAEESFWYPGRPIMITRNDYNLNLYNGDIGIILTDPADNQIRAFFETETGVRQFAPARLPQHETVFAMTVHKSQGSEFDEILLVLPDSENESITRELLYTGITRTRKTVTIWTEEEIFKKTVQKSSERNSGLKGKLRLE